MGALVVNENGTGRLRILSSQAITGDFQLSDAIALSGDVISAQIVEYNDGALLIAKIEVPPSAYAFGRYDYAAVVVSPTGALLEFFYVLKSAGVSPEPLHGRGWKLLAAVPDPLLSCLTGVVTIDGVNKTSRLVLGLSGGFSNPNWSKLFNSSREQLLPLESKGFYDFYGIGDTPTDLWMDNGDLLVALVVTQSPANSYNFGCCRPEFRIARVSS